MTLYKQLIILIIVIFMGLFLSVFYISANNLRDYINTQLSSHAQDAATSLGIAISSGLAEQDTGVIDTNVNAMFDSGYYQKIEVYDVDSQLLVSKKRELSELQNVPAWLIRFFPLITPEEEAIVMAGWTPAGTIKVTSFPEFAYQSLWLNIRTIFTLFALTVLGLFLVSSLALRALLKPLNEIELQAKAISQRQFTTLDINPVTTEFKRVVQAMNAMSTKLKSIFTEQAEITKELQVQAFQDEVTGLSNRSVFMKQLKFFSESDNYKYQGCLLIMQIHDLIEINKKYGHLKGNDLLVTVGQMFQKFNDDYQQSFVARISGTEFAIIIKSISPEQLNQLGSELQSKLNNIADLLDLDSSDIAHSGIILTYPEQTMGAMLSEADMALRLAQQKGSNAYHIYDEHKEGMTVYGAAQWNDIIIESIEKNYFELHFQPVVNEGLDIKQAEAMIRLSYEDKLISAGIFVPMAEYLNITHQIDKWVINCIFEKLKSNDNLVYSINLSQDSLKQPNFPAWLKEQITGLTNSQQKRFIIEVPEYHIKKYFSEYNVLTSFLVDYPCRFCIDHFGVGFSDIEYLHDLRVDFIKIHGSYSHEIQNTPEASNYIRQLVTMAHSLDIEVVAEAIENEQELKHLKSLKMDYFQGYHIGRPAPE